MIWIYFVWVNNIWINSGSHRWSGGTGASGLDAGYTVGFPPVIPVQCSSSTSPLPRSLHPLSRTPRAQPCEGCGAPDPPGERPARCPGWSGWWSCTPGCSSPCFRAPGSSCSFASSSQNRGVDLQRAACTRTVLRNGSRVKLHWPVIGAHSAAGVFTYESKKVNGRYKPSVSQ